MPLRDNVLMLIVRVYSRTDLGDTLYTPMPDKSETYRVEGDNAELRHYLARLARKSRCFSRCVRALRNAIKLFVYAWNRRQLYKARYPDYPAYVMELV